MVDKPEGLSSMDLVRRVRRGIRAPRKGPGKLRVGHAGTLDPLATGVVVLCFGEATREVERIMGLPKTYEGTVDLSAFTTTDDREGARDEVPVERPPDRADVNRALAGFLGWIDQRPPDFSAVHVDGQRAYRLARRGKELELPMKRVRVDAIDVLSYEWPRLSLRVWCGRGTYIRSLARDLGRALGTGGHLASLRRTAVGPYTLERSVPIERLVQPLEPQDLIPLTFRSEGG